MHSQRSGGAGAGRWRRPFIVATAVGCVVAAGVLPAAAAPNRTTTAQHPSTVGQTSLDQAPPGLMAAVQHAELTAADPTNLSYFGYAVAVSDDTAVVGAFLSSNAAYVFVRSGNAWTQQAKLTDSAGEAVQFGSSVAVSGDTAVIGAAFAFSHDTVGAAYVFVRSGTTWTQRAKLRPSDGGLDDAFGSSVAVLGDTALVGSPEDHVSNRPDQGSAYVFARSGSAWTQQAKLTAQDGDRWDSFGLSLGLSGNTAVIGAPGDNTNLGRNAGSAYVFVRSGVTWTQQAKLTSQDSATNDAFGYSVALSEDTAVIGATFDNTPRLNAGSAYVFVRSGSTWTQQARLTAADAVLYDQFGNSVAVSGDTALVGAPGHDAAYAFVRSGTTWTQQVKVIPRDVGDGDYAGFGDAVAVDGPTAIVGAPHRDTPAVSEAGAAYVYWLMPATAG